MKLVQNRKVLVAVILVALPLLLSMVQSSFSIFLYRDGLTAHYPIKKEFIRQIREGTIPYWNPAASFGQPLLANPNMQPFYPDNLIYFLFPFDMAWNFHFWFHWIFGIFGMYTFVRLTTKAKHAGILSAIWWGGSGFILSVFSFHNLIATTAWIPWAAALLYLALEKRKKSYGVLLGAALGLQFLAGEPVTSLATGMILLILACRYRKKISRSTIYPVLLAMIVGAFFILPQVVTTLEIYGQTSRAMVEHSFIQASNASLELPRLIEWAIPYCWGPPFTKAPDLFAGFRFTNFPFLIHSIHVSVFLLFCFLVALLQRPSRIILAGIVLFFVLTLGRYAPIWKWLFDWLPFWSDIHFPVKFFSAFLFLLIVAAITGYEKWLKNERPERLRLALFVFVLLWSTVVALYLNWVKPEKSFYLQQIAMASALLATFILVFFRIRKAILLFVFLESLIGARFLSVAMDKSRLNPPLVQNHSGGRTYFDPQIFPTRHSFRSIGDLYQAQTSAGFPLWGAPDGIQYAFDPSMDGMYSYYNDYFGAFLSSLPVPVQYNLLRNLGVTRILSKRPVDVSCDQKAYPLFYLYECNQNSALLFPVRSIDSNATVERTLRGLAGGKGPYSRWKTDQKDFQLPANFQYRMIDPSRFEIQIENNEPAFIVGRITYFPVWRAVAVLRDGSESRLRVNQVDLSFLGFDVPGGTQKVTLHYESRINGIVILVWTIVCFIVTMSVVVKS